MPAPTISSTVREVINGDVSVPADEIIRRVRAKGVSASDGSIRDAVYNVKSELRKAAKKAGAKALSKAAPKAAPAVARATKGAAAAEPDAAPASPVGVADPVLDLRAVLANVALVNGAVGACGGAEAVRRVAEAVTACGGVEAFLLTLELVAQVRGTQT